MHIDDARDGLGAPNLDSECTGTTMRDYLNCDDLSRVPEEVLAEYDAQAPADGVLVYEPGRQA